MRKEDQQHKSISQFRSSERFVRIDGAWWFSTREGDEGPYATREAARAGLRRYIGSREMAEKHRQEMEALKAKTNRGDPTVWNKQRDVS